VLQLCILGLDGVARASGTQTGQRKVIVQSDHPLRVVEALDVLVRLGEVLRAIHVLQHVHVPARRIFGLEVATSEATTEVSSGKLMLAKDVSKAALLNEL